MPNSLFQSTLPARGATKWKYVYTYSEKISIHAPRTGSDTGKNRHETGRIISIHAPRTGSDPAGVRLQYCHAISIHAPRTGSDDCYRKQLRAEWAFQSTLPARGATYYSRVRQASPAHFNPRSPHGERHEWGCIPGFIVPISIHAPRTGSDKNAQPARMKG